MKTQIWGIKNVKTGKWNYVTGTTIPLIFETKKQAKVYCLWTEKPIKVEIREVK